MGNLKKVEVIQELKDMGAEFDENLEYNDLLKLHKEVKTALSAAPPVVEATAEAAPAAEAPAALADAPGEVEEIPKWAQALMTKIEVLEGENKMLKDLSGKSKIADWKDAQKDFKNKFVNLKKWEGKLVVGWEKLDYSGRVHGARSARGENVIKTLIFADDTKLRVNVVDFNRLKEYEAVKIVSFNGDYEGVSQVEREGGKLIHIKTKFLNQV